MTDCREALTVVVEKRSNSRNSGCTSEESEMCSSGSAALKRVGQGPLMRAVQIGEQEADGAGLRAARPHGLDGRRDVGIGRRAHRPARRIHAFAESSKRRSGGTGGARIGAPEIIHVRAHLPADLQQVPKAFGRHQRHPAALALEQRVGGDRRAVREARDRVQPESRRPPAISRRPSRMARLGSSGVEGRLKTCTSPERSLTAEKSVKVPPTSTPTIQDPRSGLFTARPCHVKFPLAPGSSGERQSSVPVGKFPRLRLERSASPARQSRRHALMPGTSRGMMSRGHDRQAYESVSIRTGPAPARRHPRGATPS